MYPLLIFFPSLHCLNRLVACNIQKLKSKCLGWLPNILNDKLFFKILLI